MLLTQDPIGLAGGTNLYAYAGNDPVGFSDPFGLSPATVDTPPVWTADDADCDARCRRQAVEGPIVDTDPGLADPIMVLVTVVTGGSALAPRAAVAGLSGTVERIVIGETMSRVRAAGARYGAATFETTAQGARAIWKANSTWLRKAMRDGKEIIDIGEDALRYARSKFYQAEKALIERRGYPTTKVD